MTYPIPPPEARKALARQLFGAALAAADPVAAVESAVRIEGQTISIAGTVVSSATEPRRIFAVSIGKAAFTLAQGLDRALGSALQAGIAVGIEASGKPTQVPLAERWLELTGGHPIPNEKSFTAGRAVLEFVENANQPDAAVILLISGGGSALVELPIDNRITVDDLAQLNSELLACGAPIYEVNLVRGALSAIKGGRLAECAPRALKIGLIVSDTNPGDEQSVASGPTFPAPETVQTAVDILGQHGLWERISPIIREAVSVDRTITASTTGSDPTRNHVLLTSADAMAGAATAARELGFDVILASDVCEQEISAGCGELIERFRSANHTRPICLLSAGEFRTPVRGTGRGGRNTESALRLALTLADDPERPSWFTALLAGTDGLDGNCPAAGAVIDETTLARADSHGLNTGDFLLRSDSYSFFEALADAIVTGPTGTNVRDLRILLAWP